MSKLREAAQQALEALEYGHFAVADQAPHKHVMAYVEATDALRGALATCKQDLQVEPLNESEREIKRLRAELFEALSKQHVEAEPVAWMRSDKRHVDFHKHPDYIPLYTAPPQREPLSEQAVWDVYAAIPTAFDCSLRELLEFVRAIERAHGIGGEE